MFEDEAGPTPSADRAPVACAADAPPAISSADTFIGSCAQWLASDFETDRLARRWAELETEAAANFDYFNMGERERLNLSMGPEMAAIEVQLDRLQKQRKRLYRAITKMTPANLHEAACLIVIAARIDVHEPGPTAPLVRKALDLVAKGTCPHCGEPYVPQSLPTG